MDKRFSLPNSLLWFDVNLLPIIPDVSSDALDDLINIHLYSFIIGVLSAVVEQNDDVPVWADRKHFWVVVHVMVLVSCDDVLDISLALVEVEEWFDVVIFPLGNHGIDVHDTLSTVSHVRKNGFSKCSSSLGFALLFGDDHFLDFAMGFSHPDVLVVVQTDNGLSVCVSDEQMLLGNLVCFSCAFPLGEIVALKGWDLALLVFFASGVHG